MSDYPLGLDDEHESFRARMAEADDELSWRAQIEAAGEKGWDVPGQHNAHKDTMMRLKEAFPSKWLKADDLGGRSHLVTIDRVTQEEVGQGADAELKLILYFAGKQKGVVLNRTNANSIAAKHGDDTDDWGGAEVELYPEMVTFQGKTAPAIRIRIPVPAAQPGEDLPF